MKCHEFFCWEIGPFVTRWKCAYCGMKVESQRVARKLERERCYG